MKKPFVEWFVYVTGECGGLTPVAVFDSQQEAIECVLELEGEFPVHVIPNLSFDMNEVCK